MWKKKAKSKGNKILIIYFFVEVVTSEFRW